MKNNVLKKLKPLTCMLLVCFVFISSKTTADLTSLNDRALSDEALGQVTGQALFKIEEIDKTLESNGISFTKLTLGLEIAMNAIIDELSIGRYHRDGGTDCASGDFGGRFCNNTTGAFKNWQCTETDCGGFGEFNKDAGDHDTFQASALVYGGLNTELSGFDKLLAALASITGNHYRDSIPFKNSAIFPSGFEQTTDTDIKLRHLTFGWIDEDKETGVQTLKDFIIQKPFIQFAHDDSSGTNQIAGLRIGFGSSTGIQGQAIDVITGFVRPVVDVSVDAGVAGQANFTFAPYLGGVRTPGYILPDPEKTLVAPCTPSGIVCGSVSDAQGVAESSPQAQLFPLQNIVLTDSPTVWISMQNKDVLYPSDTKVVDGKVIKYDYETAKAGFWFNLGALNITSGGQQVLVRDDPNNNTNYTKASLELFTQLSGIKGDTNKPLHPDNYFVGTHPSAGKFPQVNNNYYKPASELW